jgi:hypothetical protein
VKAPRFRIAWIMVAVAIAGINFWGLREFLDRRPRNVGILLFFGALPVANVLVVGMLIARNRLGSRPFLLGFEVFGALALTIYIFTATYSESGAGPLEMYLSPVLDPLHPVIGQYGPFVAAVTEIFVAIVMLVGPQLGFALIGGFLSRRFKISVTR